MYTIGDLAKKFHISRSTLLYYDALGLLTPSERSPANYRLYTDSDLNRLEKIMLYREAGLPLEAIKNVLSYEKDEITAVLEDRLFEINEEINILRTQQSVILKLLENEKKWRQTRVLTKERWVEIMLAAGLDEADMLKWHIEFERLSPEAHLDFLESLGLPASEIAAIRKFGG